MEVDVTVRSFKTRGRAYAHVVQELVGDIGFWGNAYKQPTYLIIAGDNWVFLTFEDKAWANQETARLYDAWKGERIFSIPKMAEVDIDQMRGAQ